MRKINWNTVEEWKKLQANQRKYTMYEWKREARIKKLKPNQKRLFLDVSIQALAYRFLYIYNVLCNQKIINLKESIERRYRTKWYDEDIVVILWMIKKIFQANGEKIQNWKLIAAWWLVLDKTFSDFYKEAFSKSKKKYFIEHRPPRDYRDFLTDWDEKKFHNKNSFLKYKWTAQKHWLQTKFIRFLEVMLRRVEEYNNNKAINYYEYPKREWDLLEDFEWWFCNLVNSLKLPTKKRKWETNIHMIIRKNKIQYPYIYSSDYGCEIPDKWIISVLTVVYKDILYKKFWIETKDF